MLSEILKYLECTGGAELGEVAMHCGLERSRAEDALNQLMRMGKIMREVKISCTGCKSCTCADKEMHLYVPKPGLQKVC